jgi:signal transduction histidine kinase
MSDLAIRQKELTASNSMIGQIKDTSVSLMEKIDDLIWSINPKNDSLDSLFLRIRQFAGILFEAKEMDYTISIQENINDLNIPVDYRQHIYLILKEAINNLVKYSKADKVAVHITCSHHTLHIIISDNGKGFVDTNGRGNGIFNMKHRAAMMNAELNIDSRLNKGTTVELKVKIK